MSEEEGKERRKRKRRGILTLRKYLTHFPSVILASHCPSNTPGLCLPQGLCTSCSLCLKCSYVREPATGLLPPCLQQHLHHTYSSSQNLMLPDTILAYGPWATLERQLHDGRDFCLLHSLLYPLCSEQLLAHSRRSINICCTGEWISTWMWTWNGSLLSWTRKRSSVRAATRSHMCLAHSRHLQMNRWIVGSLGNKKCRKQSKQRRNSRKNGNYLSRLPESLSWPKPTPCVSSLQHHNHPMRVYFKPILQRKLRLSEKKRFFPGSIARKGQGWHWKSVLSASKARAPSWVHLAHSCCQQRPRTYYAPGMGLNQLVGMWAQDCQSFNICKRGWVSTYFRESLALRC